MTRLKRRKEYGFRSYRHRSGATVFINTESRLPGVIPASCRYVSVVLTRPEAARLLREWRNGQ